MAVSVFQLIYTQIEEGIDKVLAGWVENIADYLKVPLTAAFVLYIIIYAITIMRGQVQEPLNEGIKRLFKLAFIWYVAINPYIFTQYFSNVFLKFLPKEVIGALLGEPSGTTAGSLDAFINWGYLTGERIIEKSGWLDVGTYILAGVIYIGTVIAACAAFLIAAMALIVLGTLLVVGPIFVSFVLFEATNRWFWAWVSNLFSFALMQILLIALLTISGGVIEKLYDVMIKNPVFANDKERFLFELAGSPVTNAAAFGILIVYVITLFLFKKIPELTSNISGGISVGLGGFADSAKNSLTKPFTAPYKAVKGYVGGISKGTNKVIDYLTTKNTSPSTTQSGSANTSQASSSSANSIKPIGLSGSQSSSGSAGSPVPYNMYVSYGSSGLAGSAKSAGLSSSTKLVSPPRSDRYPQPAALSDSSGSSGSSPAPALYGPSGSSSSSGEAPSSAGSTQSAGSSSSSATPASSGSSGASGSSESSSSSSGTST